MLVKQSDNPLEEDENGIQIVNEITGNWYNNAGGPAKNRVYSEVCVEEI